MEDRYDKIQAYIHGELEAADLQAFEQEIASDPGLRQEVELHRIADDSIELLIEQNLRADLKDLAAETTESASDEEAASGGARIVEIRRFTQRLAVAASVLVVIGFFGAFYLGSNYTDRALARDFYVETSGLRSTSTTPGDALSDGRTLLQNEQFSAAAEFFASVDNPQLATEATYYEGLAHYGNEAYLEAMTAFDQVLTTDDVRFREKAEFNYLLATMAAGAAEDNDRFEEILNAIANNPDHLAYREVQELQEKRSSFWRNFRF